MRKDYEKFICDCCGRTFIRDKDDVEDNHNELKVFDVTNINDETKEYCSEECMLKGLQDIMIKNKTLGRSVDFRIEPYKYHYEHEEEKDETAKPCI